MARRNALWQDDLFGKLFRFPRQPVRKHKKARNPEADEDPETLTVSRVLARTEEPCENRNHNTGEAQTQTEV